MVVTFAPNNVWRIGWVLIALIATALLLRFVLEDGGGVIFTVLMGWFAAIAMAPAVNRLANHMRRGFATIIVMVSVLVFLTAFFIAFGRLFFDQIIQLLEGLPDFVNSTISAINERFGTTYSTDSILEQLNITPEQATDYASEFAGGIFGFLISIIGGLFSVFTFFLFAFYLSADGPRFRLWLASLFPTRLQDVVINVWDVTAEKTGSYVAARVILATLNGTSTAIVFLIIGMPSWLALGVWTGLVAQFVPTIGTYLAITLPVIVGLLSGNPWIGVLALAWGILYQQIENLTFEPRISARAVNVHPAVAFGSVLLGVSLFGVAGALLAIPVAAMFLALLNSYRKRYDFSDKLAAAHEELPGPALDAAKPPPDKRPDADDTTEASETAKTADESRDA
jgi:predicted PurR-regulated permease PerM